MAIIKIPRKFFKIVKERKRPTTYIQSPKTGKLLGRLEKGDKRKKSYRYGPYGRTRVIRMKKDFRIFDKGQIVGRTKKVYPQQINSILVRADKTGKIKSVKVETTVKKHTKKRKKSRKRYKVRKHKRRLR